MIFFPCHTLLVWSDQKGWYGQCIWYTC